MRCSLMQHLAAMTWGKSGLSERQRRCRRSPSDALGSLCGTRSAAPAATFYRDTTALRDHRPRCGAATCKLSEQRQALWGVKEPGLTPIQEFHLIVQLCHGPRQADPVKHLLLA